MDGGRCQWLTAKTESDMIFIYYTTSAKSDILIFWYEIRKSVMKDDWGFSFDGRTIDYFGSKAITSDITALFELIKNSRDANAKKLQSISRNLVRKMQESKSMMTVMACRKKM